MVRARKASHKGTLALLAAILAGLGGCGSDAKRPIRPEFDLRDPSACRRTEAVAMVGASKTTQHVPTLIDMLDDEDPAVRLTAGATLKSLTGHDTGYRASATQEERRKQQDAWRAWWAGRRGGAPATVAGPTTVPAKASTVPPARATGAIPPPPGYTGGAKHVGPP